MLELLRCYLGYCIECRLPAFVGEFKLAGWHHRFTICSPCLKKKHDKLIEQMPQTVEATLAQIERENS